ncbi:MAG TPA: glycosyltransferase family 9 protein [Ktedonobacteraceae bacterium]|nr:glycosyltransferase family 9 protein [Ktedonobacteraceae bacterium]
MANDTDTMNRINEPWRSARNILAVRLDNLGDVLVTTPAIHAIKTSLPASKITLFASPIGAQVGRLNPDIDDVLVYSAPWMDPWHKLPQDSQREQSMIAEVKERQFDGAIIFTSYHESSLPAAYLCYLADIPLRVAASIDGPGSLLTTRHKHPERMMHEVERGLDLVSAIGITTDERDLVLQVPETARIEVQDLLNTYKIERSGLLIVVHPGCSMPARTYPWEMYADVMHKLIGDLNATVVLTGTEDERELVERIMGKLRGWKDDAKAIPLAGELSFPALCALIEAANLTITNNTGPMHISAAVKTPVVALFALTNPPEQWGPWHVPHRLLNHDVPCRICYSRVCPYHHECLTLVSPDMVFKAVVDLLQGLEIHRCAEETCL